MTKTIKIDVKWDDDCANIESDHKLVLYTFQMFIFCPQKPKIEERKMTMMSGP